MSAPLHLKARVFQQSKLFADLRTFDELERRISALADDGSKGAAFEVFAEAYLATQRKYDAAQVWPANAIPTDVLTRLVLPFKDFGVDGVIQTVLGQYNAYQVKFRTGRPSLTWRELSTFIGLADSPNILSRVLLTNSDDLPAVLNDRQGFFCIRGSDLDRLETPDFREIETWLAGAAILHPQKTPREHQTEALHTLLSALQEHNRVSAIMACGTGKTLVALWLAERLGASRILVLLPSLALLRQTLHEWLHETSLPSLAYLCVCSDPTVKQDGDVIDTKQTDLDFEVSTNAGRVREFLDTPFAGAKIVFSTYQSAQVVGKAMNPGEQFEFGVFDEAHKTAGREGRNYSYALDDANLAIRKRLFLTATPRHYNPHQRDQEGDPQLVFSMDVPETYGPQAYRLTFAEAARQGIICNYKIVISVITSEMVTNELLSRGEVLVNGYPIRARQVANQIALRDAAEKYGVKKVFTFHRTVKSAASFVARGSEGIGIHLPDFGSFHVNGNMPTAQRERVMRDFKEASRAVMSNARCLTEGVDVPAVDMVAFLSPRRSRVDIVQATGRAMRQAEGKALGYVLVPLYVEVAAGENVEEAVRRADFGEVWDVLQSLQEQDDVLSELIRFVSEQKGRGKGVDDRFFADRIDFGGPRLSLESLRAAVTTRCLENLCTSWDVFLGQLKAFKERFGRCIVETGWEENPQLAKWVSALRTRRTKGLLSDDRIRCLDELGFIWDWQSIKAQETWMKWYHKLEAYVQEHGNPNVPRTYADRPLASWVWINRQRRQGTNKSGSLTPEQIALLDELKFRWDAREEQWQERFEELQRFKSQHGHCGIEFETGEDKKLASWVSGQRTAAANGELQAERKAKLDEIGFNWSSELLDLRWQEMFDELTKYHAEHGNVDVPSHWKGNPVLAAWVSHQRQSRKQQAISKERIRLLDEIGFTWQHWERGTFEDHYQELVRFKAEHGHCIIPHNYPEKPSLPNFVKYARTRRKAGKLSPERIVKLDAVGFVWAPGRHQGNADGMSLEWKARFDELVRYRDEHGDCDVPTKWPKNPQLGKWASKQRFVRKRGVLHPERKRLLDGIGFTWEKQRGRKASSN
jgi:superfamily II DNA or RNA helicase